MEEKKKECECKSMKPLGIVSCEPVHHYREDALPCKACGVTGWDEKKNDLCEVCGGVGYVETKSLQKQELK